MAKTPILELRIDHLFEFGETPNPLDEILFLLEELQLTSSYALIRQVHSDIEEFFSGEHPGFGANKSRYHNLKHTYSVVLATVRLLHGLHHEGLVLSDDMITQAMLSAYFHDLGMLPQAEEKKDEEATLVRFHEQRSMMILDDYLHKHNLAASYRDNCATLINYTKLDWEADEALSQNSQLHTCGQVVGTADLVAQMADRYYLESLPLLFHEQQDGGIDSHTSAIELMLGTIDFHENIIKKRLQDPLGNMALSLRTHFIKRFNLDRNLYLERIALNLKYLEMITEDCAMDLKCWSKYLRRNPPEADE